MLQYFSLSPLLTHGSTHKWNQKKIIYYLTAFIIILRHYHINLSFRQLMETKFNSLHAQHCATVCECALARMCASLVHQFDSHPLVWSDICDMHSIRSTQRSSERREVFWWTVSGVHAHWSCCSSQAHANQAHWGSFRRPPWSPKATNGLYLFFTLAFSTALNAKPNENKLTKLFRWLCNDMQSSKFIFKLTSARFVVTLCNLSTVDLFLAADQCFFCRSAIELIDFILAIALNGSVFVSFYIISIIFFVSQGSFNIIFNSIQLKALRW